ncbi:MAG: type III pantothenate kinase [Thermoleophilia bacterium]
MTELLLAIDVGNTHTVAGLFTGDGLSEHWRIATDSHITSDQLAAEYSSLLALAGRTIADIGSIVISTVVPPLAEQYRQLSTRYFGVEPLEIGPGTRTGLPIMTNNPHEVGADRIVNAVAAVDSIGGPCVVVDFGTATTFCAISGGNEYLGGAIAPGVEVSLEALTARAAQLSRVDIHEPESVIGKTTAASLRSGIVIGFAGLVDGIVTAMKEEIGGEKVGTIATGGIASLVVPHTRTLKRVDPLLTLKGLKLVHQRNEKQ